MKYNERNQIVNTVSISRGILEHLERKVSPNEFTILMFMILRADFKTGYTLTSSGDLASRTQLSQGVVRRILKSLSIKKYIKLFFESPNKTYPILINKYHTAQGDVDINKTHSISCISYTSPAKSSKTLKSSACTMVRNKSRDKEGDKQINVEGNKQLRTESGESPITGNKGNSISGNKEGDKERTLLKNIKEEKRKREEARFFETKNHSLSKSIGLKNQLNSFKNVLINFHDSPERKSVQRNEIDSEQYFIFQGSAYSKKKWELDDEWLDLAPSIKLKSVNAA